MNKRTFILIAIYVITSVVFVVLSPVLFRKRTVPLLSNDRVVAVAKPPLVSKDNGCGVYVGKTRIFSLWEGFFNFPLFIYPFADGQRFLCIYDDDAAVLVFVVDFNTGSTKTVGSREWPTNDYLRKYLTERAPHVVMETKGVVRLPNYTELQEVSSNVTLLSVSQFRTASFPTLDLGLFRRYWKKDEILDELNTNRQSVWP